jgi:diguanylate cyclase (GGDEF)-like protein
MPETDHKQRARRLASTSVLPFAVLLFAMLGAVVLTVVAMAHRTSQTADENARRNLATALSDEVNDTARQLRTLVDLEFLQGGRTGPDQALFLERVRMMGRFEAVALVGDRGEIIAASRPIEGQAAPDLGPDSSFGRAARDLAAASRATAPDARAPFAGRYLVERGVLMLSAAVGASFPTDAAAIGIVASRAMDAEALLRMGTRHSIRDLAMAPERNEGAGAMNLPAAPGSTAAHLAWTPERPGDPILERLVPIAIFSAIAITIFAWLSYAHVVRVTANMLRSEEKAKHLAGHDTLSGLPNRLRYTEHLQALLSRLDPHSPGLAVLFVDLDKFKEVNDTYGHAAGDQVIVGCAERMASQLRATDVLARFGGDEFAIIQTGVRTPMEAEQLGRRLIEAIRPAFQIGGAEAYVGASIGIALAPQNAGDAAELMRLADIAMYRAKNSGRNRACFFEQRMDDTLRLRKVVEDDLRHAIARNELELHYQPQVSADGARVHGVEALVRWRHPVHGLIPPLEFIGIAEERGLIVQLGEWVIRRACMDAANWGDITVACNVSAIQFRQTDFVQSVAKALADTKFDPSRLELELTESVVVADADQAETSIMELRSMGVKLALDDFGTGYSSLIYLRRFAFDKIKLDKSFLDSLEDTGESAILVHSVVHLGRALGLTVTAEGVETTEQQRFLQAVGCHLLQGYLFSKPVQAKLIDDMLRSAPWLEASAA